MTINYKHILLRLFGVAMPPITILLFLYSSSWFVSGIDGNNLKHILIPYNKDDTMTVNADSVLLQYMNTNYQRVSDPIWHSNKTLEMENCGWEIRYTNGATFQRSECNEWGIIATACFADKSKHEVIELVNDLFYQKHYSWYNNEYRPFEYYEFAWTFRVIQQPGFVELKLIISTL